MLNVTQSDDATKPGHFPGQSDAPELHRVTYYSSQSEIRQPVGLLTGIVRDFWAGRELSWRLFLRNIRAMYRQTLLGLFWAFLPPIANTAIWIFLRSQDVFDSGDTGVHPTLFILTGMILWQSFIESFQMPLDIVRMNRPMISKLNFPRESLLLVGLGEVVFNLAIRLLLLIPAFLVYQVSLSWHALAFPLAVGGLILVGVSLGMLLMPIGSLYEDVGRFITTIMPFWMIVTPIIYAPLTSWPGSLLNWINPAAPLLILSRDLLLSDSLDHLAVGAGFGLAAIPLTLLGLIVYRISMPVLIERMSA